jgi:hypothetical protein
MDPDGTVATIEVLQHVAVGGQFNDPAAKKVRRMPPESHTGPQTSRPESV